MHKSKVIVILLMLVTALAVIGSVSASAKCSCCKKQATAVKKQKMTNADKLALIDKYQEQYFAIVKRNDILLNFEDSSVLKKDRKELKKLFTEVKKQITNKQYLKKYNEIEKHYAVCDEITTTGINDFSQKNYDEVEGLLNAVYKDVQSKISQDDFKKLVLSEKKWIKDVQNYKKVYDSMDFGTIGTSIYLDYQTDMSKFRALLLMLYL